MFTMLVESGAGQEVFCLVDSCLLCVSDKALPIGCSGSLGPSFRGSSWSHVPELPGQPEGQYLVARRTTANESEVIPPAYARGRDSGVQRLVNGNVLGSFTLWANFEGWKDGGGEERRGEEVKGCWCSCHRVIHVFQTQLNSPYWSKHKKKWCRIKGSNVGASFGVKTFKCIDTCKTTDGTKYL